MGSEKRQSSTPAEHSEHLRLSNILDQMPVGIGIFDAEGKLFHSNRFFEHAAGGAIPTIDSMTGETWKGFTPEGTFLDAREYPGLKALMGEIATPGAHFMRTTNDGASRWVGVSAVPLNLPDRSGVAGAVVVVEDIDDRYREVERARMLEGRFRRFAEHSSEALWIANIDKGVIEYLSPAAARLWPHHQGITTLAQWLETVHHEDRARALDCRIRAACGEVQKFPYRIVNEDGMVHRLVRETAFSIPGNKETEHCIGGIVEDISPDLQVYLVGSKTSDPDDLIAELRPLKARLKIFSCSSELLDVADYLNPGCVVVDLRGKDADPDAVPLLLRNRPADLQIVLVGGVTTTSEQIIDAMRLGAIDYVIAPVVSGKLARAVETACQALPPRASRDDDRGERASDRIASLPKREREVLMGLVAGGTNKKIARTLDISPRTVEAHRAHLMERLNVRTLTELLHLAHAAGLRGIH